ncbi:hypothetical protein CDAR_53251 [Caerostris darwini]|uniref:Secreted protein n=1 Tax=Caerostris darwini TaxID=1538125 RepID=A0AAV4RFS3_9ARAC|nr:hypothetical protein CDAR_53251 [Caerostris darwini]
MNWTKLLIKILAGFLVIAPDNSKISRTTPSTPRRFLFLGVEEFFCNFHCCSCQIHFFGIVLKLNSFLDHQAQQDKTEAQQDKKLTLRFWVSFTTFTPTIVL